MLKEQELEDFTLERDIESAKLCDEPGCRRVATHCSTLLDALLIFKTWFIQRQGDLDRTIETLPYRSDQNDRRNQMGSVSESHMISGPSEALGLSSSAILSERDWALRRMRQMELQVSRLRSVCFALRTQLEAGLRHKAEVDQVRRELEMTKETVSHYRNIIDEGNKLREDLRSELARVRKEASLARSSHFNVAVAARPSESPFHRLYPHSHSDTHLFDEADTAATTILAIGPPTDGTSAALTHADTTTHLRAQLERQIRWRCALDTEAEKLRETVRVLSEKEADQLELLKVVRDHVTSAVERISHLKDASKKTRAKNPFGSVLNLRWISTLAAHLHVKIPEDLALVNSSFLEVAHSTPSTKPSGTRDRHNKRKPPTPEPKSPKRIRTSPTKTAEELADDSSSVTSSYHAVSSPSISYQGAKSLDEILSELPVIDDDGRTSLETDGLPLQPNEPRSDISNSSHLTNTENCSVVNLDLAPSLVSAAVNQTLQPLPSVNSAIPFVTAPQNVLTEASKQLLITASHSVDLDDVAEIPHFPSSVDRLSGKSSVNQTLNDPGVESSTSHNIQPTSLSDSSDSEVEPPNDSNVNDSSNHTSVEPPATQIFLPKSTGRSLTRRSAHPSIHINDDEAVATRVLTCPAPYVHKSDSKTSTDDHYTDVSQMLLSFLTPDYSPEVIQWFDRITTVECESITQVPLNSHSGTTTCASLTAPITSTTVSSSSGSLTVNSIAANAQTSQPNPHVHCSPLSAPKELITLCTNYLRSRGNSPPSRILLTKLEAESIATCVEVVCSTFLSLLTNTRPSDRLKRESRFITICSAAKDTFPVQQICEWILSHFSQFVSPHQVASFTRCIYGLFSLFDTNGSLVQFAHVYLVKLLRTIFSYPGSLDQFGLQSLPYIIDACRSNFPAMWSNVQPFANFETLVSDPRSTYSPYTLIATTLQSILAWQEAHWHLAKCTTRQGKKVDAFSEVFSNLHDSGWLHGDVNTISASTASAALELSHRNHQLRCIALRLVDICLQVHREDGDPLCCATENSLSSMEAACSLVILLSSMAMVVGDEAVVANPESDVVSHLNQSLSTKVSHQRKRRHRQTQRHQRLGLLGWLLTGRLFPWLCKHLNSLRSQTTPNSRLLFTRLFILCIDIVTLGYHLFCLNPSNEKTAELHSTIRRCGCRLIHLLDNAATHLFPNLCFICAVRLSAFSPQRAINLAIRSTNGSLPSFPPVFSLLWSSTSPYTLVEQSLNFVSNLSHFPTALFDKYKRTCESFSALSNL